MAPDCNDSSANAKGALIAIVANVMRVCMETHALIVVRWNIHVNCIKTRRAKTALSTVACLFGVLTARSKWAQTHRLARLSLDSLVFMDFAHPKKSIKVTYPVSSQQSGTVIELYLCSKSYQMYFELRTGCHWYINSNQCDWQQATRCCLCDPRWSVLVLSSWDTQQCGTSEIKWVEQDASIVLNRVRDDKSEFYADWPGLQEEGIDHWQGNTWLQKYKLMTITMWKDYERKEQKGSILVVESQSLFVLALLFGCLVALSLMYYGSTLLHDFGTCMK